MWLGHIFAAAKRLLAKTHPPDGLLCALVAAARFAAHLALIVSASCARRSGVRLSFLFTFLGALGSFTAAAGFLSALPPYAADFLFVEAAAAVSAAPSFCFSLASFLPPFCSRASSRRILFLRLLSFFIFVKSRPADC